MRHPAAMIAAIGLATLAGLDCPRPGIVGSASPLYFQMGEPRRRFDPARTNGARAAAASFGVKLVEQYSGWQPEVMLEALPRGGRRLAACIEIMGHPGNEAFAHWWRTRLKSGIVVTSGNSPLSSSEHVRRRNGFGYAGVDLTRAASSPRRR